MIAMVTSGEPHDIFQAFSARVEMPEPDANSHGIWVSKSHRLE
jgi:hypothetical protein